ncbi:MAG: SDR family oxidoreductase [Bacteroidota bacterium]
MRTFNNQVVWITGASSGIGEALVHAFAKAGAKVVLSARRENELKRVQSEAGLTDENSMVLPLDLTKFDTLPGKAEEVLQKFGQIDQLINNGGISQRSLFMDTDMEVFERIFDLNVYSVIAMTKAVLPHMQKRNSGHLSVVSSVAGKMGPPLRTGYAASKHAVIGMYDSLRAELTGSNINVTVFCPGYVITNISKNALSGDGSKHDKMDTDTANGLTAEQCANQMLDALAKKKFEVVIAKKEKYYVLLKRFVPNLFTKILGKTALEMMKRQSK